MATAQLDLILNAQKYQAQLVKQLGLTEKQAAREGIKMARADKKRADEMAKNQARAAKKSSKAWKAAFTAISVTAIAAFAKQALTAVADLTKEIIDYKNEITDAATRTGLTNTTLQGLKLAAEGSGQEFSSWVKVVEKVPKLLADVEAGSKRQIDAFAKLGVETHDLNGDMRSADDVLRDIVEQLGRIEDPTTRAARAADIFGRSGGKMVQALAGGADQLDAYIHFAERWGVDVGPEAAEVAARNQREFAALGMVWSGIKGDLAEIVTGTGELGSVTKNVAGTLVTTWTAASLFAREYFDDITSNIAVLDRLIEDGPAAAMSEWQKQLKEDADTNFLEDLRSTVQQFNADWDAATKGTPLAISPGGGPGTGPGGDNTDQSKKALEEIAAISKKATSDLVSDEQRIRDAYQQRYDALLDIMDAYEEGSKEWLAADAAAAEVIARRDRDLTTLRDEAHQKYLEQRHAETEAAKKASEEAARAAREETLTRIGYQQQAADAAFSIYDSIAGAASATEMGAWKAQRAGALAQAALNTYLGVSEASASAPPPYNAIPMAIAAAQGAANFAAIAAVPPPSLYGGGTVRSAYADPDGALVSAEVHTREQLQVVPQGRTGDDMGGMMVFENYVDGKQTDIVIAKRVKRGGPTQAQITRRAGRVGRSVKYRSI